jgi:hypothetical protein
MHGGGSWPLAGVCSNAGMLYFVLKLLLNHPIPSTLPHIFLEALALPATTANLARSLITNPSIPLVDAHA